MGNKPEVEKRGYPEEAPLVSPSMAEVKAFKRKAVTGRSAHSGGSCQQGDSRGSRWRAQERRRKVS